MAGSELSTASPGRPVVGVPAERAAVLASYDDDLRVLDLPDRDLTEGELEALAASIAQQPGLWRHLVAFGGADGADGSGTTPTDGTGAGSTTGTEQPDR